MVMCAICKERPGVLTPNAANLLTIRRKNPHAKSSLKMCPRCREKVEEYQRKLLENAYQRSMSGSMFGSKSSLSSSSILSSNAQSGTNIDSQNTSHTNVSVPVIPASSSSGSSQNRTHRNENTTQRGNKRLKTDFVNERPPAPRQGAPIIPQLAVQPAQRSSQLYTSQQDEQPSTSAGEAGIIPPIEEQPGPSSREVSSDSQSHRRLPYVRRKSPQVSISQQDEQPSTSAGEAGIIPQIEEQARPSSTSVSSDSQSHRRLPYVRQRTADTPPEIPLDLALSQRYNTHFPGG